MSFSKVSDCQASSGSNSEARNKHYGLNGRRQAAGELECGTFIPWRPHLLRVSPSRLQSRRQLGVYIFHKHLNLPLPSRGVLLGLWLSVQSKYAQRLSLRRFEGAQPSALMHHTIWIPCHKRTGLEHYRVIGGKRLPARSAAEMAESEM